MQCTSVLGTAKEVQVTQRLTLIHCDEQEPQQGGGTIPSLNFCKTGHWCFLFYYIIFVSKITKMTLQKLA